MDASPSNPEPRWRRLQWGIVALFILLAYAPPVIPLGPGWLGGYVWTQKPGYGPDEPRHFAYVRRLVEKQALPLATSGHEEDGAHALHPPLYYLLVAPVYAATRGLGKAASIQAIKCVSPLLLLGALLLFLAMLRRIFPGQPFAASAALAVVALLPEFQLEAAIMNNDVLAILLGALYFWLLVRSWDEPPSVRTAVLTGLVLALFVNTKAQGWTLAPLWALALFLRSRRTEGNPPLWLRDLAIGYGILALLGTWWYVRNYMLYGQPVMLSLPNDPMLAQFQPRHSRTGAVLSPLEVYTSGEVVSLGWRAVVGLFQSFWSQVDWIRAEYGPAVYSTLLALVAAAVAGGLSAAARWWRARRAPDAVRPAASPLLIPAAGFLLTWLNTWYLATFVHLGVYQGGRYLMPAVFGAGALLGAGWQVLLPRRWQFGAALALVLLLLLLNALCLVELAAVLNPKYVTE